MRLKVIALSVALLCVVNIAGAANVVRTASTPTTYCIQNLFVKEGDVYKMSHDKCPKAQGAAVICVAAATVDPGTLLVWPAQDKEEPLFRALTYAGIQDGEIVLTRDPGPSIRLPIKGVFTRYGILDIAGFRIILDIVYPDKIVAKVRHAAKRCRCR